MPLIARPARAARVIALMILAAGCGGRHPAKVAVGDAGENGSAPEMRAKPEPRAPAPPVNGVGLGGVVFGTPPDLAPRMAAILVRLGYELADSAVTPDEVRLVTRPRFTWSAAVAGEPWHGAEHPGVRVSVNLRARGDSTAVNVIAESPLRADPSGGSVSQRLRFLSAIEIGAEMTKDPVLRPPE